MKRITLTDPEQFITIWQGFNSAPPQGTGLDQLNHIVKVLDKLEAISQSTGDGPFERAAKMTPCQLIMEDQEFKTLLDRLNKVQWTTIAARRARDIMILLGKAEDVG